jgi:hypothetical protein
MTLTAYRGTQKLELENSAENSFGKCKITVTTPEGKVLEAESATYFHALIPIRKELETVGILLSINAARINATPALGTGYTSDRVSIINENEVIELPALSEAFPSLIGTVQQQEDEYPKLVKFLETQKEKKVKEEKDRVKEVTIKTSRMKFGLIFAFFTLIYPVIPGVFLYATKESVPDLSEVVNNPSMVQGTLLSLLIFIGVGILIWATAIVQCVTEIARTISSTARLGLTICLTLPVIWVVLIAILQWIVTLFPSGSLSPS